MIPALSLDDGVHLRLTGLCSHASFRLENSSTQPHPTRPPWLSGDTTPPRKPALNLPRSKMGLRPHGTFWVQRLLYFAVSNKRMSHSRGSGRCSPCVYHYLPSSGPNSSPFLGPADRQPVATSPRKPSRVVQDVCSVSPALPQGPCAGVGKARVAGTPPPVPKPELVIAVKRQQITRRAGSCND